MDNFFKKVAWFTDIHFGERGDSELHNQDCLRYIDWFIDQVKEHDCDTIIFGGDWYHNQSRLRLDTNWYSIQAIEKLNDLGLPIWWMIGNHDMFYKSKRTVHSLPFIHKFKNIHVVNDFHEAGDVLLCPWLVGTEFGYPPDRDVKYVFGHFQLPLFLANASYEMPDKGGLHADHFYQCDAVFSGHFHKRQIKINENSIPITYTGNCFGHNYNDVNDRDRGCMILEWDQEPLMINWPDAPNYNRLLLSNLMDIIDKDKFHDRFNVFSVIECKDDLNITLEETLEVKDSLQEHVRSIKITNTEDDLGVEEETQVEDEDFQNLDDLIVAHLLKLDTDGSEYKKDILVDIYNGATK